MDQENKKDKKSKSKGVNNSTSFYLIIISSILILFFGGYLVYDMVSSKVYGEPKESGSVKDNSNDQGVNESTTTNNADGDTNNVSKELDTNSRLVQKLYKMVYDDRGGHLDSWIYPNQDKIIISELSNEAKLALVFQNIDYADLEYFSGCDVYSATTINERVYACTEASRVGKIKNDTVLRVYKEIFGSNAELPNTKGIMFTDVSKTEAYVSGTNAEGSWILHTAVGGNVSAYTYKRNITKAVSLGAELKIYETIIAVDPDSKETKEEVVYTFKLEDDGVYTYYSRDK